eukprot:12883085-Heterocapsa_arctica.AAC.1
MGGVFKILGSFEGLSIYSVKAVLWAKVVFGAILGIPQLWSQCPFSQDAFGPFKSGGMESIALFFVKNSGIIVNGSGDVQGHSPTGSYSLDDEWDCYF